jgi:hypothetical protein
VRIICSIAIADHRPIPQVHVSFHQAKAFERADSLTAIVLQVEEFQYPQVVDRSPVFDKSVGE